MFYDFPYVGNVIIPTDELIFFREVGQPPTNIYIYTDTISSDVNTTPFLMVDTTHKHGDFGDGLWLF